MKISEFLALALLSAACAMPVLAADGPAVDEDADLPHALDLNVADELLANSPFTRALNLSDSLRLTGIAYVEGRPVATLVNKATKESYLVSEEPNAQGWKLAATSASTELRHTEVLIMVGAEIVSLHYGDEQLTPASAKKGSLTAHSDSRTSSYGGGSYGGDQRIRSSSYLGENGRERYSSLSDKARDQFKDTMHKIIEKHPEMTMEQRSAYAEKLFSKVQAGDQKAAADAAARSSKSSVKISKSGKSR